MIDNNTSAIDVIVWPIASYPGVQNSVAHVALKTAFMPTLAFGKDLICMINKATASWAALAFRSLDDGIRNGWHVGGMAISISS